MTHGTAPQAEIMNPTRPNLPNQAWKALSTGAWGAARRLCDPILAQDPDHPEALHVTALALWGEGELPGAIQYLSRAANVEPTDPSRLSDLGVLYIQEQNWQAALECFNICRRLQPKEPTVLQGQAEALIRLGRFHEAAVIALEQQPSGIHLARRDAWRRLGADAGRRGLRPDQNAGQHEEKNEDQGKENGSCQRLTGAQSLASLGHRLMPRLSAPSRINHAIRAGL